MYGTKNHNLAVVGMLEGGASEMPKNISTSDNEVYCSIIVQ
jgi:hypothetical protein